MTRRRFRYSHELGRMVEVGLDSDTPRVAPDVMGDLPAYESPIDGACVDGRAARRADLAKHGCRPYEEGEAQEAVRRRAADDARLERSVDATVERWWHNASGDKREALARAIEMGLQTQNERK
jgi:hypothetical protein